jgi:rubrerythrin
MAATRGNGFGIFPQHFKHNTAMDGLHPAIARHNRCKDQEKFNSGVSRMKVQALRAAVLIAIATSFSMIGSAVAGKRDPTSKATAENLSTAMHGEAFAYAKYMLYAERARQNGNKDLADLFEASAKTERFEHFAEEARLAGLVGSDAENLRDAMKGESYEVETMYRQFAEKATAAGDKKVAERFEEIRHDEMKHRDVFKAALTRTDKPSVSAK